MTAFRSSTLVGAAALAIAAAGIYLARETILRGLGVEATRPAEAQGTTSNTTVQSVEVPESAIASTKIQPAEEREFPLEKEAIGSIDFNGEMTLQVFAPYQGRIIDLFAKVGDEVKRAETLFTIDSPDLVQAASTLIATAGVLELTTRNLARLRDLVKTKAAAQKDLEQAISDQQAAEGAYKASRDAVRIFGKSEAEIDRMVAERRVDRTLALVMAPLLRIASLCIVAGASSRLVLAGVRDGVDHDMRQVMIGQPVEHLAAGPLAGDHARRLEDLEMLADQRLRHAQRVDQFVDAALRLA